MIQINAKQFNPYNVSYIKESVFHYYNDHKHILLSNGVRDSSFFSLLVDEISDNPELSIIIFHTVQVKNHLSEINIPETLQTELIEKVHKVMDELWLTSQINYIELGDLGDTLLTLAKYSTPLESSKEFSNFYDSISSYSSDSWFSSGSSFSWWWGWFSSWWGGGWWGGRSW